MAPPRDRRPGFSRRAQYSLFIGYVAATAGALIGAALLLLSSINPQAFASLRAGAREVTTPLSSALYWVRDFETFFALMLVHSLFYVPTLSIANSVAFAHIKDPQREFPRIRMGGTVGWILAAWPLFFILQGKEGAEAVPLKLFR